MKPGCGSREFTDLARATRFSTSLVADPLYFGASLVALGEADGSVAGAVNTTANVMRAGIHCVGMAEGISVVSSMVLMVRGDTAY